MKKILLSLVLILSAINANDINSILFEKIFTGIFPDKTIIKIYIHDKTEYNFTKKIIVTDEIYNADIIFLNSNNKINIINNKPIFVSNNIQLSNNKNAIGALFWKKGRPQIVFLRDRLKEQNIELADFLKKYIE